MHADVWKKLFPKIHVRKVWSLCLCVGSVVHVATVVVVGAAPGAPAAWGPTGAAPLNKLVLTRAHMHGSSITDR